VAKAEKLSVKQLKINFEDTGVVMSISEMVNLFKKLSEASENLVDVEKVPIDIVDDEDILKDFPAVVEFCNTLVNPGLIIVDGTGSYSEFMYNVIGSFSRMGLAQRLPISVLSDNRQVIYLTVEDKGKYIVAEDGDICAYMSDTFGGF